MASVINVSGTSSVVSVVLAASALAVVVAGVALQVAVPHQNRVSCWEVFRRWEGHVSVFGVEGILVFPCLGL